MTFNVEKKNKILQQLTFFRSNGTFIPDGKLDARAKVKLTFATMLYMPYKK